MADVDQPEPAVEEASTSDTVAEKESNHGKDGLKMGAACAIQLKRNRKKSRKQKQVPTSESKKKLDKKARLRAAKPGHPNNPTTAHDYNLHRLRVQTARPYVDTSPPIVPRNFYSQPTSFNRRLGNFTRIEKENAIMLRRIAHILEGGAVVDHKLKVKPRPAASGRDRQMNLLRITFDNLALLKKIQNVKPLIDTKVLLAEYKKNEEIMERFSSYPLFWKVEVAKGWEAHVARAKSFAPISYVFLRLSTDTERLGQVSIELNYEAAPMTCENFRCLCTGELGLSYKCSQIHRIVPGILWQGGDVTGQDGFGNKSIYGDTFPDENFRLKHDEAGVVSMANCGPNSNGSQFIITARSAPALDGINVAFGRVVAGMDVLTKLNDYLGSTGVPKCDIHIYDCGSLTVEKDEPSSDDGHALKIPATTTNIHTGDDDTKEN